MKDYYAGKFNDHGNKEYARMRANVPQFDPEKHYLVATEDDSGNLYDFIGVSPDINQTKSMLRLAYKRIKKAHLSPTLMLKGRAMSFKV